MKFYSYIAAIASLLVVGTTSLSAQDYFWFDDGGTITPAEGTVDQLDQIVIDYTNCEGTANGLNIGTGKGSNWITSANGNYSVTFTDDYANHQLKMTVVDGPIVKAGDYKLSIPEGAFNVYGNTSLINDAVSYFWTVSGNNDLGDAPRVELIESYPADGQTISLPISALTLTFNQDVTVSHSVFDAAARISNLTSGGYIQLNIETEGNVVTLTKGSYSSSDFMAGQQYELEIYAGKIKSASDPDASLPPTTIGFSIAKDDNSEGLQVMAQIPAAGENIHNAGSVTFNMNLTSIDAEKISLVNENGHLAPLSSVGRDSQAPKALIFNIDPNTHLQGNSTYKLHLEAGAVTAGNYTNETMDAAYWCIPTEQFSFTSEMAGRAVPEFQDMVIFTEATELEVTGDVNAIKVIGVSTNSDHVYAELADFAFCKCTDATHIALSFDKLITPALLAEGGAIYNSVKVVIPEGTFTDEMGRHNKGSEFIIYVIEEKEIGEQTWTFNPADGSRVDQLGFPWTSEDGDGNKVTYYNISFSVSGENVFVRIPDGSLIYLRNTVSDEIVHSFQRNDAIGYNNKFTLELGDAAITEPGYYQLVIPAEAINIYSDAGCQTNPIHPAEDVTASWIVGDPEASLRFMTVDDADALTFDLMGRKATNSSTGLHIINHSVQLLP